MLIDQYQLSFQRYTIGTEEFLQNSIFAAKLRYLIYSSVILHMMVIHISSLRKKQQFPFAN